MNSLLAFTIVMLIWTISDYVSKKTKALLSSLFVASGIYEVVIIGQDRSANLLKDELGLEVERVVNRNLGHAEEEEVLRRAFEA